jgi:translation initiation factor IF-3
MSGGNPKKRSFLLPKGCKSLGQPKEPTDHTLACLSVRLNRGIRAKVVDLRNEKGGRLGTMPIGQALACALDRGLDLIEIGSTGPPPICLLMDYGAFRFIVRRGRTPKAWLE